MSQTSNFTCVESNANERKQCVLLICIRFDACEIRRLTHALNIYDNLLYDKIMRG